MKKRALVCMLPSSLVSDLGGVCTYTPTRLHTTTKGDAHALDDRCDRVGVVALWLGLRVYAGGFIHLLLLIAVVVLVMQLLQGRRTPPV